MSFITAAVIVGGATLGGAYLQSQGAKNAANTQADAAARAQAQVLAAGAEGAQQYAPYTAYGQTTLSALGNNMPYFQQQFTNQDLNANLAPNYAFQLQQGQASNNAANNALGGMNSGNAQQALQQYTQNYAGTAYQNALSNYMNQYNLGVNSNMAQQGQQFNQNQAQQTNIYNRLTGLAGLGLTGAQGSANAQIGTGTNIASLTAGLGNAQAASQIAQGNIYGNAANTAGNVLGYTALNQMSQPSSYGNIMGGGGFSASGVGNDLTGGQGFTITPP